VWRQDFDRNAVRARTVRVARMRARAMRRAADCYDCASEREGVVAVLVVGLEIRAALEHARARTLSSTPKPLENGRFNRQQRFADVEPRVTRLFQRNDVMARWASNAAAVLPAGPPPITATSHCSAASSIRSSMLPGSACRKPNGKPALLTCRVGRSSTAWDPASRAQLADLAGRLEGGRSARRAWTIRAVTVR